MTHAFLLLLAFSCISCASGSSFGAKPHILVFIADDFGWGNLGYHRPLYANMSADALQARLEAHTPNLDILASSGVIIDRHYSYKICSPARSSFQSGRLAVHVNTGNNGVSTYNKQDQVSGFAGIPRNMTGLGEKMRLGGYSTSMVGKWDAGMATPEQTPSGRGCHYYDIIDIYPILITVSHNRHQLISS